MQTNKNINKTHTRKQWQQTMNIFNVVTFVCTDFLADLIVIIDFNSFFASGDFCHLLIAFGNNLGPDQDRQNVGHDLDPNCLTLC